MDGLAIRSQFAAYVPFGTRSRPLLTIRRHRIRFQLREPGGEVDTIRVSEDVLIDMAPDGTICGIELLNANEQLNGSDDGRFVFVDPETCEERHLTLA